MVSYVGRYKVIVVVVSRSQVCTSAMFSLQIVRSSNNVVVEALLICRTNDGLGRGRGRRRRRLAAL